MTRCYHHFCRTSLDDDTAIYCPHGRPFCDGCTWEEACEDCLLEPLRRRAAAAWDAPRIPNRSDDHDADWLHEQRAEDRAYELAQLEDREEMRSA